MTQLGWTYDQFMDSTFYFFFGVTQQWLIANGAKRKAKRGEIQKLLTFDQLPGEYW